MAVHMREAVDILAEAIEAKVRAQKSYLSAVQIAAPAGEADRWRDALEERLSEVGYESIDVTVSEEGPPRVVRLSFDEGWAE
jgi:hypothetical protein